MPGKHQLMTMLDEDDMRVLKRIARTTGHGMAQVMRWALRFYARSGPWTQPTGAARDAALKAVEGREVGIIVQENHQ